MMMKMKISEIDPLDFAKPLQDLRTAILHAPGQDAGKRETDLCLACRAVYHSFLDRLAFRRSFEEQERIALESELKRALVLVTESEAIGNSIKDKIEAIKPDKLREFARELDELG